MNEPFEREATEHRPTTPGHAVLFGPFRLLPGQQVLLDGAKQVALGARAFDLLIALTSRPGEVLSKADLMARVWPGMFVDESNVRVHVAGLRKALRDGQAGSRYIINVPGRGYSFVAPVQVVGIANETPGRDAFPEQPASLPRSATRVIGRAAMMQALSSQLAQRRFVTLVGPGGIGKTTVAIAVARELSASYPDGVWFVDFSSIRDPRLVPATMAVAFGLAVPSQNAMPAVIAHLGRRNLLLVLDNCEHVIETAAEVAEHIFSTAIGVHILSTSREPLRAAGERVHRLSPLESPSTSVGLTAQEALTFPCIQLFVERVAANLNGFCLSDADAPAVAEICQKLDGIALAIELAASRVAAFGIRELAARLGDRFQMLTSGRRTALPRHQTLAATLDWSYELLSAPEQMLLCQLAIFTGEFSLSAAAAITKDEDASLIINDIAGLVSKSLVVADESTGSMRYRLLETTRLYCLDRLQGTSELGRLCRAHARYLLILFEEAEPDVEVLSIPLWLAKYAAQIDNLRAALDWATSTSGDTQLYVALTIAAVPLWIHLSLMAECRLRVEHGLAVVDGDGSAIIRTRMRLLAALGWSMMYAAGRADEVGATWAATLELADALDDTSYRVRAIWGVWISKLNQGDMNTAVELANRLLALVEGSSDQTDLMLADRLMATTLHYRGDQDEARLYIERMLDRYSLSRVRPKIARFHVDQQVTARYFQARILWLQGYADQALQAVRRNIREGEALGQALSFGSVLGQAACPIALLTGDMAAAHHYASMLLDHSERHALHLWNDWAHCFKGLLAIKEGDVHGGLEIMGKAFDKAGDSRFLPRYMVLLGEYAEAIGQSGQHHLGLLTIEEMLARCQRTEERWYSPELMRIRGNLLALEGGSFSEVQIEEQFVEAIRLAGRQGARSWQLRAASSLAKFRRDTGNAGKGLHHLSDIYAAFSEGFATSDLRWAAQLLSDVRE